MHSDGIHKIILHLTLRWSRITIGAPPYLETGSGITVVKSTMLSGAETKQQKSPFQRYAGGPSWKIQATYYCVWEWPPRFDFAAKLKLRVVVKRAGRGIFTNLIIWSKLTTWNLTVLTTDSAGLGWQWVWEGSERGRWHKSIITNPNLACYYTPSSSGLSSKS